MIGTVEEIADRFAAALGVGRPATSRPSCCPRSPTAWPARTWPAPSVSSCRTTAGTTRWPSRATASGWTSSTGCRRSTRPTPSPAGFDVVVHLAGVGVVRGRRRRRAAPGCCVRTRVPEGTPLASVTDLWPGRGLARARDATRCSASSSTASTTAPTSGLRPLLLPEGFEGTPLRKSFVLAARASKPWPGAKEPGESDASLARSGSPSRRKLLPPGVPAASWGPPARRRECQP